MNTMTHHDFLFECEKRFGPDAMKWKVSCPRCGTVQCMQDFKDAGVDRDTTERSFGFSCIGRFTGGNKGCDWTLGGLLHIHTLEVLMPNGATRPTFEIAGVEA